MYMFFYGNLGRALPGGGTEEFQKGTFFACFAQSDIRAKKLGNLRSQANVKKGGIIEVKSM